MPTDSPAKAVLSWMCGTFSWCNRHWLHRKPWCVAAATATAPCRQLPSRSQPPPCSRSVRCAPPTPSRPFNTGAPVGVPARARQRSGPAAGRLQTVFFLHLSDLAGVLFFRPFHQSAGSLLHALADCGAVAEKDVALPRDGEEVWRVGQGVKGVEGRSGCGRVERQVENGMRFHWFYGRSGRGERQVGNGMRFHWFYGRSG
eukprot:364908-Chlamydomonas_euryale.AAC.3